jgi:hypothetical protein
MDLPSENLLPCQYGLLKSILLVENVASACTLFGSRLCMHAMHILSGNIYAYVYKLLDN